jgi:hypothetical protein
MDTMPKRVDIGMVEAGVPLSGAKKCQATKSAAVITIPGFTGAQRARLTRLRAHVRARAPDLTCGLDVRRLQFARWLVERGRLSEGVEGLDSA